MTEKPSVEGWIRASSTNAPPALVERAMELLELHVDRPSSVVPSACMDALEYGFTNLVRTATTDRTSALDLLAMDALVTWAFEAAADEQHDLDANAKDAMIRIAKVVEEN